jgi:MOSC domain-containing protein YiiM
MLDESQAKSERRAELIEVRTGTVKPLGDTDILSAIDKLARDGPVWLGPTGFDGDQHGASEIHGGPDMAVLQYAAQHYDDWALEFPDRSAMCRPGGFGENLVSRGIDETSVCIGDRIRIGAALVQVSQPRQPCFKLNLRFQEPTMSRRAEQSGRTGWFYRVLEPGAVAAGDPIEIVDRPHPDWPVRRVLHVLYDELTDRGTLAALSDLAALSASMRALFIRRLQVDAPGEQG